ncbi:ABC transporter ATP-binding protein [Nocardia seriolae]|uniref:ABC transporter ATP-binding protein n=1 Tax=Nocardia seriolae TaxID=37332 RepID=UPI0011962AA2|nr:ABC transporter ATP-binding protein [Nocardia seriolae]GEM25760.1 multidrug ABC transporter ATP-binding protein [Nocardia seriolae NBRC 15557]
MYALVIDDLHKSYGSVRAVDGVSWTVEEGEIFGLLGPNGSGKTTTVECAYGLRAADSGRVRVLGHDPRSDPDSLRTVVGAQLQDSALPERIRVWEAVRLFASLARYPVDVTATLAHWGLAAKRNASYASLSGGQRQRLHVALALVTRPRLVFLDEMTTGLDPNARREVWGLIEQVRRAGATIVLVTHFMDEAERLCDRVAVLRDGKVAAQGTPAQLVRDYGGPTRVVLNGLPPDSVPSTLASVRGVQEVRTTAHRVEVLGEEPFRVGLGHTLAEHGLEKVDLTVSQPSLEDAYLRLMTTGAAR